MLKMMSNRTGTFSGSLCPGMAERPGIPKAGIQFTSVPTLSNSRPRGMYFGVPKGYIQSLLRCIQYPTNCPSTVTRLLPYPIVPLI